MSGLYFYNSEIKQKGRLIFQQSYSQEILHIIYLSSTSAGVKYVAHQN